MYIILHLNVFYLFIFYSFPSPLSSTVSPELSTTYKAYLVVLKIDDYSESFIVRRCTRFADNCYCSLVFTYPTTITVRVYMPLPSFLAHLCHPSCTRLIASLPPVVCFIEIPSPWRPVSTCCGPRSRRWARA